MYNLPYISYGIFAFVLVAIWLLAWKKGFRAALCSFVLTLATVGVILAISFGIYSHIAPLFSSYIKQHFDGDPSYDFNYFANAARPQVIAICIAVGFIPVYAILFGISYPIYRHFKRNDYPRLTKFLGPNSKKVKTVNKKMNKLGAVVATSVTSVASAGFVAAASGVLFTTAGTYNGFNDAMSILSFGTSYGFSKDSLSLHKMYEFIPMTKDQDLMKFSQVLAPNSKTQLTTDEINKIKASPNFEKFIKLLTESEAQAILNVLTSKYSASSEDIEYDGIDSSLDLNISNKTNLWRPLGNETSKKNVYSFDIAAVEKLYAGIKFGLDPELVETLISWIEKNGIQKFEDTQASKLLDNAIESKKKIEEDLAKAKSDKLMREGIQVKLKAIMNDEKAKMFNFVSAIKSLREELATKTSSNAEIFTQASAVSTAKTSADNKHTEADIPGQAFEDYTGIQKSSSTTVVPSLSGNVINSNAEYQVKIQAVLNAEANVNSINSQITVQQSTIDSLHKSLDATIESMKANTVDKTNLEGKLRDINSEISKKELELTSKHLEYSTKESELKNEESKTPQDTNKINSIKKQMSDLKTEIDAIDQAINKLKSEKSTTEGQIKTIEDTIARLEATKTSTESQISNAGNTLNTLRQNLQNAQNTLNSAINEKALAESKANNLLSNYLPKFEAWKNADQFYESQLGELRSLADNINSLGSQIRAQAQGLKESKSRFDNAAGQNGVISWNVASGTKVYEEDFQENASLWIQNISDFTSLPNEVAGVNQNSSPIVSINPQTIPVVNDVRSFKISTPVSLINIDRTIWGDGADYKASYLYSIPYLVNRFDPSKSIAEVPTDSVIINGYDFKTKKISKIKDDGTTEGLIAVLEFNLTSTNDAIEKAFKKYREEQKQIFDDNVKKYLSILKEHLGA